MLDSAPGRSPRRAAAGRASRSSDLKAQFAQVRDEVVAGACSRSPTAAGYVLGPKVAAFEEAFAAAHGVKHCVGVNTGTSALHLALIAAGVGPGDEVITVPMTFIATSWAISYCRGHAGVRGRRPGHLHDGPGPGRADRITPRTKAILPVHLYGQPADLGPLLEIAERHGIPLIEDAAQAHLATYRGQPVGGVRAGRLLQLLSRARTSGRCGEGGAVVTNDDAIAARMRALRDHAQTAALPPRRDRLQLPHGRLPGGRPRHQAEAPAARGPSGGSELADRYLELLARPAARPAVPSAPTASPSGTCSSSCTRTATASAQTLEARGIQTGLHYPIPLHLQQAYRHLGYEPGDFPVSERIGRECFTLPLFPEMTDEQQDAVVEALADVLERRSWTMRIANPLEGATVLVTGGAGLIGSHIVDQLIDEGAGEIRVLDNLVRGRLANLAAAVARAADHVHRGRRPRPRPRCAAVAGATTSSTRRRSASRSAPRAARVHGRAGAWARSTCSRRRSRRG